MRFAEQFFPALLTSLTVLSAAHADVFISRLPTEPDYLVQHCTTQPQIKCWSNAHLNQAGLRKVRRKVARAQLVQTLACASTVFLCDPVVFPALPALGRLDVDLRELIRSPKGGLIHVPDNSPVSRMFGNLVDGLSAPATGPEVPAPPAMTKEFVAMPAAGSSTAL